MRGNTDVRENVAFSQLSVEGQSEGASRDRCAAVSVVSPYGSNRARAGRGPGGPVSTPPLRLGALPRSAVSFLPKQSASDAVYPKMRQWNCESGLLRTP